MNTLPYLWVIALVSLVPPFSSEDICAQTRTSGNSPESDESAIAQLSEGTFSGSTYHNPDLGISYEVPPGWSISDKKTQQQAISDSYQFVWTEDVPRGQKRRSLPCAKTLLFTSKYSELMRTSEFNPFAVLIAADPRCVPGVSTPTSGKDQNDIQRIASNLSVYFKTVGLTSLERGRIQTFDWGGRVAFEIRQRFRVTTHGAATMTTMEIMTSTLVLPSARYWVMCMSVGADDSQLKVLRAAKIFFDAPKAEAKETNVAPASAH